MDKMSIKYLIGSILFIPLLPLMYFQGKRIRARIPQLPEAQGASGVCQAKENASGKLNLIFVGESTIAGVGVETHEEGFAGTFAKEFSQRFRLNVSWKVYARSGYTARRVAEKLIPRITEPQVDLITVGLGGNDAFTLNRPSRWRSDIRALIRSLRTKFPGAIIVFCNMPPIKEFPAFTTLIKFTIGNLVEILGAVLQQEVMEEDRVFYFSERISLKTWVDRFQLDANEEDFFSDGVHPSKLTYQTWAKGIVLECWQEERIRNALQPRL